MTLLLPLHAGPYQTCSNDWSGMLSLQLSGSSLVEPAPSLCLRCRNPSLPLRFGLKLSVLMKRSWLRCSEPSLQLSCWNLAVAAFMILWCSGFFPLSALWTLLVSISLLLYLQLTLFYCLSLFLFLSLSFHLRFRTGPDRWPPSLSRVLEEFFCCSFLFLNIYYTFFHSPLSPHTCWWCRIIYFFFFFFLNAVCFHSYTVFIHGHYIKLNEMHWSELQMQCNWAELGFLWDYFCCELALNK